MTQYHRGRVRSPYRKHAFQTLISFTSPNVVARVQLRSSPTDGLIKIKSVRTIVLFKAMGSQQMGAGWIGYARSTASDTQPDFEINQSEVFGVQEFCIGDTNDQVLSLPLKGITLAVGEAWHLVGEAIGPTNSISVTGIASILYAIESTDAT